MEDNVGRHKLFFTWLATRYNPPERLVMISGMPSSNWKLQQNIIDRLRPIMMLGGMSARQKGKTTGATGNAAIGTVTGIGAAMEIVWITMITGSKFKTAHVKSFSVTGKFKNLRGDGACLPRSILCMDALDLFKVPE